MESQNDLAGRRHLHVAVPVLLVDEVLPTLKDTELRVLLIVLRQTNVAGRATENCWLTHKELCRRTGRASEAVSGAVETLANQGLLRVTDEAGKQLHTPCERQQATGRHHYGVPYLDNQNNTSTIPDEKQPAGKAKTIEDNNKPYSFRKTDFPCSSSMKPLSPHQKQCIESEKIRIRENLQRLSSG